MTLYIVHCSFMNNNYFGTYSSLRRARIAFEHFCQECSEIIGYTDNRDYTYEIETINGETFGASIETDILDYEFSDATIDPLED